MCYNRTKTIVGTAALCFSAGVISAYLLPGFIIAFLESAVLVAAGIMLIKK